MPIKKKTQAPDSTQNFVYEIDLSKTDELCRALKIRKDFDCLPVLWVFSTPSFINWRVKFEQRLACKFMVLKLIDSIKNSTYDNNMDMYNLGLYGHTLKLPPALNSSS